ncbi:ROK family glucokinase [Gottfriedia acidiceleris]|uniref:ROK family glucokinase n=1 Tax=Bacillaceae TaxID=186817 RepID=UPI000BEBB46E|nr:MULTISPECIES: ROK family glucokinase [unclassified Bacillus (in: firmicutes)]PEC51221.1 glucokinase [Bacillus sp. AFS096315]PFM77541.1 glucokinase [Bacillus sp. AFS077874]
MMAKMIVGVDLGGTSIKLALLTNNGEFIDKWEVPTDKSDSGKHIPKTITIAIEEKLKQMDKTKEEIAGIGIGAPGSVRLEDGLIFAAVNLGWVNFPLKEILEKESGIPVIVDNDANIAAVGEMWKGAGNGAKDVVMVTLGTGVGGGVIVNGDVAHGISGSAGEIGHITVQLENGVLCNCGKRGCLETISSATGIARIANEKLQNTTKETVLKEMSNGSPVTTKDVFEAYSNGDEVAEEIVNHVMRYLALVLAGVGNTLNPENIIIGGGVSNAGELLLKPLKKYFDEFAFTTVRDSTRLSIAKLGNDAGAIGAAYLVKKFITNEI